MTGRHVMGRPRGADESAARTAAEHLVDPGSEISDGTSVTVDLEAMPVRPHADPSAPRPGALVDGAQVGDGHEME
jgi:hypothetical protein